MRKHTQILILIAAILLTANAAHASYTIDGVLDDWGVTLGTASQHKYYLDNNLPSGGNDIDFVTEDNTDQFAGTVNVGPGVSTGNKYDVEAIYFDNDEFNAYIAVVTGLKENGDVYPPGDIFLDTVYNPGKYEYGIDIATSELYSVSSWEEVSFNQHSVANPWRIGANKTYLGDVNFVYGALTNSHYVLEVSMPLSLLGLSASPGDPSADIWVHWTMKCGNDYLLLRGDVSNPVPEPASMFLLASGFLGLVGFKKRFK